MDTLTEFDVNEFWFAFFFSKCEYFIILSIKGLKNFLNQLFFVVDWKSLNIKIVNLIVFVFLVIIIYFMILIFDEI